MNKARIDQKDQSILDALKKDARMTVAELSHALGIPRATIHERIAKLRASGAIKRFTIVQDHAMVGMPALLFVFASCKAKPEQVAKRLPKIAGVQDVYMISGKWDLLIKVRGKSVEDIGTETVEKIRGVPGIARTKSVACFEAIQEG